MAEHTNKLEKYQNTHYSRFSFISKDYITFPKRGFRFYCELEERLHFDVLWFSEAKGFETKFK